MLSPRLPRDDGSIERALAGVESKLAAWSAAMVDAQTALAQAAEACAPRASAAKEPQPVWGETRGGPVEDLPAVGEANQGPQVVGELQRDSGAAAGEDKVPGRRPESEPGSPTGDEPGGSRSPGETGESGSPAEDEEALLASVDEETAAAIRIMRRLAPHRRSVRELIEQYQSTRPLPAAAQPKRRSWWTRGKQ